MKRFQECVQQVGTDVGVGLCLDVSTSWYSTYLMLESATKYRKAFGIFQFVDETYNYCPSDKEWMRAMTICEFLNPLCEITKLISSSSYPTSNSYFMQICMFESILNENLHSEDEEIKDMLQRMKLEFDKYWKDYSTLLAFGAIVNPRLKLKFLKFCYHNIDAATCHEKLEDVKAKLYKLFEGYASNTYASSISSQSTSNLLQQARWGNKLEGSNTFRESKMFQNETIFAGKCELDVYLDEANLDYEVFKSLDVLNYWKDNAKRFPDLSIMAWDIFSVPNATVASDSAFRIGDHVFAKYRNSLHQKDVQMRACTKNWLYGFSLANEDYDNDDLGLEISLLAKQDYSVLLEDEEDIHES